MCGREDATHGAIHSGMRTGPGHRSALFFGVWCRVWFHAGQYDAAGQDVKRRERVGPVTTGDGMRKGCLARKARGVEPFQPRHDRVPFGTFLHHQHGGLLMVRSIVSGPRLAENLPTETEHVLFAFIIPIEPLKAALDTSKGVG